MKNVNDLKHEKGLAYLFLAESFEDSLGLKSGLETVTKKLTVPELQRGWVHVLKRVCEDGETIAYAMREYDKIEEVFRKQDVRAINLGEETGTLPDVLRKLAKKYFRAEK